MEVIDGSQFVIVVVVGGFIHQLFEEGEPLPHIVDVLKAALEKGVLRHLGEVAGPGVGGGAGMNLDQGVAFLPGFRRVDKI
jgi:hypothetical protein